MRGADDLTDGVAAADVLARPKFRRWISAAVVREFVDGLADESLIVDDPPALPGVSPDPGDDYLIALARRGRGLPRLRRRSTARSGRQRPAGALAAPVPQAARRVTSLHHAA
jgi:hypothetical protein